MAKKKVKQEISLFSQACKACGTVFELEPGGPETCERCTAVGSLEETYEIFLDDSDFSVD